MGVDYVDFVVADKSGDTVRAQYAERISDRHVQKILRRDKSKLVLPQVCRTQGGKHFVAASLQSATQIHKMPFASAIGPGRRYLQDSHRA